MKKNLKFLLRDKLKKRELEFLSKSYDIIGDIAIIRVPEAIKHKTLLIADTVLRSHKHVKTVLQQIGAVSGDFRLRKLEWVAGEKKTVTKGKEFGCFFEVDLNRCYYSPRLSFERMRVTKRIQPCEVVLNMFAGVGCFSIVIAKHTSVSKVYSIDVNPSAVKFMCKNIRLNRVQDKVIPILGDAKRIIEERLSHLADRVLMPLPGKAYEYLEYALTALKPSGGWIIYYDFVHANKNENPVEKVTVKVAEKMKLSRGTIDVALGRVVRATGPRWFQVALDIYVKEQ